MKSTVKVTVRITEPHDPSERQLYQPVTSEKFEIDADDIYDGEAGAFLRGLVRDAQFRAGKRASRELAS